MRFAGSPTHNSASRERRDLLPHQLDRQDPRGLHGHHGRRGAAHAGGAPHLRVDAGPARPEPGRPAGFAATGGGRAEEPGQGGNAPRPSRQGPVHARAGDVLHPGAPDVRRDPVRHAAPHTLGRGGDGRGEPAGGIPLHSGVRLARRVRHRAGRVVVEQQVLALGRPARERSDDLVRDRPGHEHGRGAAARGERDADGRDRDAVAVAVHVERVPAVPGVFHFYRGRVRRDESAAVRPARGGRRADRRLSHRVQRDKFSMFYIAEYSNMVTASALVTTLFFGGYDIPFTHWDNAPPWTVVKLLATLAMFAIKVGFFLFLFIWVRWTLPRFRYDQLMALGWKVMLPLALGYVTVIATAIWFLHDQLGWTYDTRFALALFGLNLLLAVPLFFVLDRGHIIAGSVVEEGGRA